MRWLAWFILAYVVLGLQTGLAGHIAYDGAAPNLVLIAVIFIALNAPRDAALLGCYCMGLMQDMLTQEPLGMYALSYGVITFLVQATQPVVYRDHPLTHVSLALSASVVSGVVLMGHGLFYPPRPPMMLLITTALYTAAVAPFMLWPLQKIRRGFAFQTPGRKGK